MPEIDPALWKANPKGPDSKASHCLSHSNNLQCPELIRFSGRRPRKGPNRKAQGETLDYCALTTKPQRGDTPSRAPSLNTEPLKPEGMVRFIPLQDLPEFDLILR